MQNYKFMSKCSLCKGRLTSISQSELGCFEIREDVNYDLTKSGNKEENHKKDSSLTAQ